MKQYEDIFKELYGKSPVKTLTEVKNSYLIDKELANYSETTIKNYRYIIERFCRYIGDNAVTTGNGVLISKYKEYMLMLRKKGTLSMDSLTVMAMVLRELLKFGQVEGAEDITIPKRGDPLPRNITPQEVKILINAFEGAKCKTKGQKFKKLRNKLIVTLLYSTGIRVSELVGIRLIDLNLDQRTVRVKGKGRKERLVIFTVETLNLIIEYLKTRPVDTQRLFSITMRTVQRVLKTMGKKAGIIQPVTPHILRHSFATHQLIKGVNIKAIQQLLGHKSLVTTQIYTTLDMGTIQSMYDEFN